MRSRRLLSWGFRQLGVTGRTAASIKLPIGRYVVVEIVEVCSSISRPARYTNAVKRAASQILSHLSQGKHPIDRIYTMGMFRKLVTQILNLKTDVADTDLSIILTFLARDKRAIIYDHEVSSVFPLNQWV